MSYPPPPQFAAQPAPAGKQRLRGRIPLRLAIAFGAVGLMLLVIGVVVLVKKLGAVDDYTRVGFGQTKTVQFSRTGSYVGYYEDSDRTFSNGTTTPLVQVVITGPVGRVPLEQYSGSLTYNLGSHHGTAIAKFTIPTSGRYQITVGTNSDAPATADMAFGDSFLGGLVGGVLLIVAGVLLGITAIVLLIVGLVRRSGHKKQLAGGYGYSGGPPPGYGGPPPGYGGPQPGYGGGPPPGYDGPPPGYGGPPPGYGGPQGGYPGSPSGDSPPAQP